MTDKNPDRKVTAHIEALVGEERRLRSRKDVSAADRKRLESLEVELDQCWDLLRQRRAFREFDEDPDQARVRPPDVVEKYEQ